MKADLAWLENPEIFQVNRLEAHSDHHFYETEKDMESGSETLRQSLNGDWRFAWSRSPAQRPAEFFKEDADLSGFGTIEVPGHIELQGFDRIHYVNSMYPWDGHAFLRPPHIDWDDNPVGSYVKEFDLAPGLLGKRVAISFQGAEQAVYVWLNGTFIGYAEDSFTPSDFDLTDAVREKGNRLCVEVYKHSSAGWLEDQDFFRFSGIFRDVYLYAKPQVHVEDLRVKAGLEDAGAAQSAYRAGTLELEVKISGAAGHVAWSLADAEGQIVKEGSLVPEAGERSEAAGEDGARLCEQSEMAGEAGPELCGKRGETAVWRTSSVYSLPVIPWNAGASYLYRLLLRVYDETGALMEVVPYQVGFRRFEIRDGVMLLNGERLIVNGVNRHEWNPRRGRAVTEADMRRDIEILKKNHINAVRTCHYPNQSLWYRLCDEAGICVMDETNLESHGSWQKMGGCEPSWNVPGSEKEWEACVVDRAASMLERDKNHPSVLWWSCGNESYAGTCILAMSRYFHQKDSTRPVHYEGVFHNRAFDEISDVESRMYATPQDIREYLEHEPKKPFLLCEYMHDMGNSLGGMESYMRLLDEFPMYQGGFIWDYIDQAVYYRTLDGKEALGYGGDFGDRPADYAFSGDGILFADRTEKPAMQEVRYWYDTKENRAAFDAENARARREAEERVGAAGVQSNAAAETKLDEASAHVSAAAETSPLRVVHGDENVGVYGENFYVMFSLTAGGPVSLVCGGREYLYRAPRPTFWRASTDNDKGNGFPQKSAVWAAAELFSVCRECRVREYTPDGVKTFAVGKPAERKPVSGDITRVEITYTYVTDAVPGMETEITYLVDGDGIRAKLHYHGKEGLPELPAFGLRFIMPERFDEYTWLGLSGETYPDRKKGGRFGRQTGHTASPAYLVPQECGNHADTFELQVGALRFVAEGAPFHCAVLPHTPMELEQATHQEELPKTHRTVVSILGRMRGLGGIDSWGADVEAEYHVSAQEDIRYGFRIVPEAGLK